MKILHVGPPKHGIAAYDQQIEAIYRQLGFEVVPILVDETTDVRAVAHQLAQEPATDTLCHFEMGSGDTAIFELSRRVLALNGRRQLVTIHDSGIVVRHPVAVPGTTHSLAPVRLGAKMIRKVASRSLGRQRIERYLSDRRIQRVYLREDLAQEPGTYYLPQPTYHAKCPAAPMKLASPLAVGYGGYWGFGKGLETLLEAVAQLREAGAPTFRLIVGGGPSGPENAYTRGLRDLAKKLVPDAEMPGFIADEGLDAFLQGLAVLVLPYWPELPNGASAMAMRAAELGVPVIASDTLALKSQLGGADGATFVTPKDTPALREALATFVADPRPAQERAQRTQERIFAGHNWQVVGQKLAAIIAEVTK